MTYELAKKLKDAGFPKTWWGTMELPDHPEEMKQHWYPTLAELIEACGDDMVALQRAEVYDAPYYEVEKGGWEAVSKWEDYYPPQIDENFPFGKGATAEEAVGALWLSLNEKED